MSVPAPFGSGRKVPCSCRWLPNCCTEQRVRPGLRSLREHKCSRRWASLEGSHQCGEPEQAQPSALVAAAPPVPVGPDRRALSAGKLIRFTVSILLASRAPCVLTQAPGLSLCCQGAVGQLHSLARRCSAVPTRGSYSVRGRIALWCFDSGGFTAGLAGRARLRGQVSPLGRLLL